MEIRRRKKQKKPNASWMTTYSDLMTLVLIFFILLFASSQLDSNKFRAITDSFQEQQDAAPTYPSLLHVEGLGEATENKHTLDKDEHEAGNTESELEPEPEGTEDTPSLEDLSSDEIQQLVERKKMLERLVEQVEQFLAQHDLEGLVTTEAVGEGLILTLQDRILFESGEASFLTEAEDLLDMLGQLLAEIPHFIRVEGHSDDIPISTERFPSNWELSTARASQVIRYLIDEHQLEPSRMVAVGYGEHRPIESNESEEGRQKNRRVVLVITDTVE